MHLSRTERGQEIARKESTRYLGASASRYLGATCTAETQLLLSRYLGAKCTAETQLLLSRYLGAV